MNYHAVLIINHTLKLANSFKGDEMSYTHNPKTRIVNLHCGRFDFHYPLRVWCNGRWSDAELLAIYGTQLILSLPKGCYGSGTDERIRIYDMAWHNSAVMQGATPQLKNIGERLPYWTVARIRLTTWLMSHV